MLAAWRERCPIYLVLRDPNEVTVTTEIWRRGSWRKPRRRGPLLGLRLNAVIPATLPGTDGRGGAAAADVHPVRPATNHKAAGR